MIRKHPFVVGTIHHIYNRGAVKLPICKEKADYWRFIQGLCLFNDTESTSSILWRLERDRGRLSMNVLKKYILSFKKKRKNLVNILAYCVMDNHYHLLLEEVREGGITQFMHKFGTGYSKYFNNKYEREGSLCQNIFKNILVDNENYLLYLLVYINVLNPLDLIELNWKEKGIKQSIKKILKHTEQYQFSSHLDHSDKRNSLILNKNSIKKIIPDSDFYFDLVNSVLYEKKYEEIEHLVLE